MAADQVKRFGPFGRQGDRKTRRIWAHVAMYAPQCFGGQCQFDAAGAIIGKPQQSGTCLLDKALMRRWAGLAAA